MTNPIILTEEQERNIITIFKSFIKHLEKNKEDIFYLGNRLKYAYTPTNKEEKEHINNWFQSKKPSLYQFQEIYAHYTFNKKGNGVWWEYIPKASSPDPYKDRLIICNNQKIKYLNLLIKEITNKTKNNERN